MSAPFCLSLNCTSCNAPRPALPPFNFRGLPQELRLAIAVRSIPEPSPRYQGAVHNICFDLVNDFTHIGYDGRRFELTVRDIIRHLYKQAIKTFPRDVTMKLLFTEPDGRAVPMMEFANHDIEEWNHIGDERIRASIAEVGLQPFGTTDQIMDYYWMCFLSEMDMVTKKIEKYLSQIPESFDVVKWSSQIDQNLPPLWRFLGPYRTRAPKLESVQSRYDYLATLTIPQRREINNFLDNLVMYHVMAYEEAPYVEERFYRAYHHASTDDTYGEGLGISVDFPWAEFVRSGAYAICLKHFFLSLSYNSFWDLLSSPDPSYPTMIEHGELVWSRMDWERELINTDQKTLLMPEATTNIVGESSGSIRLTPQKDPRSISTMEMFVQLNPLWAWNQALELPQGQPLDISGRRSDDGSMAGIYLVDRLANAYPE